MFNRLKNTLYAGLIAAGALGFSYFGGCSQPVEPIKQNQKPVASFIASPKTGIAPLNVNFDGRNSRDPDGTISKYIWEFGDGNTDSTSGIKVNYNYNTYGNYASKLSVRDNQGMNSDKALENIVVDSAVVVNQKPVAQFTATPKEGNAPLIVNFDATTSYDPDGTIDKGFWDDGDDGIIDDSSSVTITRNYAALGTYLMSYFVRDNKGALSEKKLENIIVGATPVHKIAFYSLRKDGTGVLSQDIYLMSLDGNYDPIENPVNLTNASGQYQNLHPSFSPDGKKIVWERNGHLDGLRKLYTMGIDGSNKEQITTESGLDATSPAWSPDGNWIAFVYSKDSTGIAKIRPDKTGFENIVTLPATPHSPSWSPDGNWITFGGFYNGVQVIYKVGVSSKNLIKLTEGLDVAPHWTSNNRIIFTSERAGGTRGNLWDIDINGADPKQITWGYGPQTDAKFNGEKIVFAAGVPNDETGFTNPTLYIINWDGTELKQIIFTGVNNRYPEWCPKP